MVKKQNIGRFELKKRIGSGSQAIVYLATDNEIGRQVAIKLLKPFALGIDTREGDIFREARAVGKLNHPNIVPIYEVGKYFGYPYLVFEYVNGKTLTQILYERPTMTIIEAVNIIRPIVDAMAYAHAHGVLHLDLTPNNIMFDHHNIPMIMDFGLSRVVGSQIGDHAVTGTPRYMSPEHFSDTPLGPYTDVFSLSLIFYEMLTGKKAIVADVLQEKVQQIIDGSIDLSILPESRDQDKIMYILQCGLDKNVQRRYVDATVMKHAISISLNDEFSNVSNVKYHKPVHGTIDFLLRRMQRKGDFPALSTSCSRINQLVADDSSASPNQLAAVVLKDYSLTNKLLKMANSAFYASFGNNVSDVSYAIRILGFRQVRFAANSLAYFSKLQGIAKKSRLQDAIIKSFLSGLIARHLAKVQKLTNEEEAFICGMFQNLGETLTAYYFTDEYEEINQLLQSGSYNKQSAAQAILGVNFSEIGSAVARSWNFPDVIVNTIDSPPVGGYVPDNKLARLAIFANELCHIMDSTDDARADTDLSSLLAWFDGHIPVNRASIPMLMSAAYKMLQQNASILEINVADSVFCANLNTWIQDHMADEKTNNEAETLRHEPIVKESMSGKLNAATPAIRSLPGTKRAWYKRLFRGPLTETDPTAATHQL